MSLKQKIVGLSTDKDTVHSYLETYESLFRKIKLSAKAILEIGIYEGGSIRLWKEYFSNARIYGVDITTKLFNLQQLDSSNIHLMNENAYTLEFVQYLKDRNYKFDVIIDDGPHTLESMTFIAKHYPSLLTKNGILIIEDIQFISWVDTIIPAFPEEMQEYLRVIDLRTVKHRYDDVLIVLNLDIS